MGYIPVFSSNYPNGGKQKQVFLNNETPVFSSYTGAKIVYGPISRHTKTDAIYGQSGYKKDYRVIVYNELNSSWMAHDYNHNYSRRYYNNYFGNLYK